LKDNLFADKRINYKDFLIILIIWYFIIFGNFVLKSEEFAGLIYIEGLLAFIFNVLGHLIFFLAVSAYFNILYDFSLQDLGIKIKSPNISAAVITGIIMLMSIGVIIINLSAEITKNSFKPLYTAESFSVIMGALPFLIFIFAASALTAAAEQFLFNKVIFSIFNLYLPAFPASILTALFASVLLLQFNPAFTLIIFFAVLISNFLYIISSFSLTAPIIFYASFLTLYTAFIYGFSFNII